MIRLVYVGVLSQDIRGLEHLCEAVVKLEQEAGSSKFIFDCYGFGPLAGAVSDYSRDNDAINFHGSLPSSRVGEIYEAADILVGMYYVNNCEVHRYAAPNKLFEHLIYQKPILTNHGHSFSGLVEKFGCALLCEESSESMVKVLKEFPNRKFDFSHFPGILKTFEQENIKSYRQLLT